MLRSNTFGNTFFTSMKSQTQSSPITFRPPDDVRLALDKRRKAGENVSQIIVAAIRRFLKIK